MYVKLIVVSCYGAPNELTNQSTLFSIDVGSSSWICFCFLTFTHAILSMSVQGTLA
jgi:hypothetical protein